MFGSEVTRSCMRGWRRKSDFSLIISTLLRLAGLDVGGLFGVATQVTKLFPLTERVLIDPCLVAVSPLPSIPLRCCNIFF